jgi:hypothetical protein
MGVVDECTTGDPFRRDRPASGRLAGESATGADHRPQLPIIDTHHHLWDRTGGLGNAVWADPASRYLMPEFLADIGTGHNVVGTVFMECHSMWHCHVI